MFYKCIDVNGEEAIININTVTFINKSAKEGKENAYIHFVGGGYLPVYSDLEEIEKGLVEIIRRQGNGMENAV